jgi:Fic family protein
LFFLTLFGMKPFARVVPYNIENLLYFIMNSNNIEDIPHDVESVTFINHYRAFDYLKGSEGNFSILELHRILMEDQLSNPGTYRKVKVRVADHVAPDPRNIPSLMRELETRFDEDPWFVHNQFLWIHPFVDGNGRTARLLLNNLHRLSYSDQMIIVDSNKRDLYYQMLEDFDRTK